MLALTQGLQLALLIAWCAFPSDLHKAAQAFLHSGFSSMSPTQKGLIRSPQLKQQHAPFHLSSLFYLIKCIISKIILFAHRRVFASFKLHNGSDLRLVHHSASSAQNYTCHLKGTVKDFWTIKTLIVLRKHIHIWYRKGKGIHQLLGGKYGKNKNKKGETKYRK